MRHVCLMLAFTALSQTWFARAQAGEEAEAVQGRAPDEEIFTAAGFQFNDGAWGKCGDPGTPSYGPGAIIERGDFNGDGFEDAIVTEGGTYCFAMTGTGYTLVSSRADGSWRVMDENIGIPRLLETKGADNWPDIEIGGGGFCSSILRWNGSQYAFNRSEYEGSPCQG